MNTKLTHLRIAAGLLGAFAAIGCGGKDISDRSVGPRFAFEIPEADDGEPIPVSAIPFPSDLHIDSSGDLHMNAAALPFGPEANAEFLDNVANAFEELDCFGISGGVVLPVLDLPERDGPTAEVLAGSVFLVDLDSGETLPSQSHFRRYEQYLHVRPVPGVQLEQGTQYAVYVTGPLTTEGGASIEANLALSTTLSDEPAPAHLERPREVLAPLRAHLDSAGVALDTVMAATVFTTCEYDSQLAATRELLGNADLPEIVIDRLYAGEEELDAFLGMPEDNTLPGLDNEGGIAHADLAFVAIGRYASPNFLSENPGHLGAFEFDSAGEPLIKSWEQVTFLVALPAMESYESVPVAIFQHGLGMDIHHILGVANSYASHGIATVGIDIPFHGGRRLDGVDRVHNYTEEETPDGLIDDTNFSTTTTFFDLDGDDGVSPMDPLVMSDSFRQSAADILFFARLVREGDWTVLGAESEALAQLSFLGDKLIYTSESFGGFVGTTVLAFDEAFEAAWMAVAGGGLIEHLLPNSPSFAGLFLPTLAGSFGLSPNDIDARFDPPYSQYGLQMLSMLLDRADPLTYAHLVAERAVHVALPATYADEVVPNHGNEVLATALGLDWARLPGTESSSTYVDAGRFKSVAGPVSGNRTVAGQAITAAFFETSVGTHGMYTHQEGERKFEAGFPPFVDLVPPKDVANPTAALQEMFGVYATSYLAGEAPVVDGVIPE